MQNFTYLRPTTLAEALSALAAGSARPLAGGTDLLPQMRENRRCPERIVDIKQVPECISITFEDGAPALIGAAVPVSAIARHPEISARYPALAAAGRLIGSRQIQNRATLGGNVCNAAPSGDAIPALLVHDAVLHTAGPEGRSTRPFQDIFAGPGRTNLPDAEIVLCFELPATDQRSTSHYLRFTPRREMDIAVAGVAARIDLDADGNVATARIALASVAPTPVRAAAAEATLKGAALDDATMAAAAQAAVTDASPISDTRGSADYRRSLIRTLTRRTLDACRKQLDTGSAA